MNELHNEKTQTELESHILSPTKAITDCGVGGGSALESYGILAIRALTYLK